MLEDVYPVKQGTLESFITDFIVAAKAQSPDIGHIMVVYSNIEEGNTIGAGSITGIKDIKNCIEILEHYLETLKASIPQLH